MTIEQLIVYGKSKVNSQHAKMLLADLLHKNSLELLNILSEEVDPAITDEYYRKINLLAEKKPIQYVIGNVDFCGYPFLVNEKVLIPRFETEELVEKTRDRIRLFFPTAKTLIDLGCGSGAIGITLKKMFPSMEVTLLDISKDALQVAIENAKLNNVTVQPLISDMWSDVTTKFDIVISNPPYIKTTEEIDSLVKENEPHLALYDGPDGLDCYRKIIANLKDHLNDRYLVAFEIGYTQAEVVSNLLKEQLPDAVITVEQDLQERDRMVFAMKVD